MPADADSPRDAFPSFVRYFLAAATWLGACLLLSQLAVRTGSPWPALLATLAIATPAALSALYTRTTRLIHRAALYRPGGWLRRLRTGRVLPGVLWILGALLVGAATVPWLASLDATEVAALFLATALFHGVVRCATALVQGEMAAFAVHAAALRLARIALTLLMTALYLALPPLDGPGTAPPALADTFRELSTAGLDQDGSYVVQSVARAAAYLHGTRDYLLQQAAGSQPLYLCALIAGTLALFYNLSLMLSGWLVPAREYRRVFTPLEPVAVPAPVPPATTVSVAALAALLVLSLLPLLAMIEQRLREDRRLEEIVPRGEAVLLRYAERIDGALYEAGTLDALAAARRETLGAQARLLDGIEAQARRAFDAMRANVDRYLDWYYSLPAEYLRIVSATTGSLEDNIRKDLEAFLVEGSAIDELDGAVAEALAARPALAEAFAGRRAAILADKRLAAGAEEEVQVIRTAGVAALAAPPPGAVLVDLEARLALASGGGVGAVVAAKVTGKVAAKGGLKLAAKAMGKVATSKAVSWAGGAATGAAVGSVVPGIGTLAGAAVGAAAGLALGVSVDALLLALEENHSRADFRQLLMDAIDAEEREFLALLRR